MWSSVCRWPLNLYEYASPAGASNHRFVSSPPCVSVGQRRGELEVVQVTRHEHVAALCLQLGGPLAHVLRLFGAAHRLMRLRRPVVAHRGERQVALAEVEHVRRAVEQRPRVQVADGRAAPRARCVLADQAAVAGRDAVLDQEAGRDPAPVVVGGDVARVVAERRGQAGERVGAVGEHRDLLDGDDVRLAQAVPDRLDDRVHTLVVLGLGDDVTVVGLADREQVLDVEGRHADRVRRLRGRGRRRGGVDRPALDRRLLAVVDARDRQLRHHLVEAEAERQRAHDVARDVEQVEVDLCLRNATAAADRRGCRHRRPATRRSRRARPTTASSLPPRRSCGTAAARSCPARGRGRGTWSSRRRWRCPPAGARACPAASGSTCG